MRRPNDNNFGPSLEMLDRFEHDLSQNAIKELMRR